MICSHRTQQQYEPLTALQGQMVNVAEKILDRAIVLEPFASAKNPIRCLIGQTDVYHAEENKELGNKFWMQISSTNVEIFEDACSLPEITYEANQVTDFVEILASAYKRFENDVEEQILRPLKNRFPDFNWVCVVISEDVENFGITTRPRGLPFFEAVAPDGERIIVWAMGLK